ncbi:protein kinase domain-containing protein [Sphingomonas sp.]|uniref:serine/threonine protein kinase n=1 Tax=Sphingomonas sp. TaxID=28214 RepID=UPI00286BD50C|nr:protein kinase [Sphingomonas sp.]
MTKAYSNRALPAGTVLREWRLEEVLGVGGFGIVYKARGIYFDELVAIKEYFPGSISERDAEDTVVPIDSDAEEVHALGLKKFVEEAKLLWNLSTPTRHPNIVNVRSLFEIHGTAYMVMDFEDGVSLAKLLKQSARFNERSLLNIIRPIAEGLERAHRVGVLHRDIKPPNILINPDGRPVLIDFGSARFESADATSTTVTFHTPPYAAIEQYVKTYPQGPWTDVYALGVVVYECVAGEKPLEVLERLHGGHDKPLADSHWPGFSPRFLAAVDQAMRVPPKDRPQSISEWLALFEDKQEPAHEVTVEIEGDDEDATRFATFDKSIETITPVAPPAIGSDPLDKVETRVPSDPNEVQFKRAGEDSSVNRRVGTEAELPPPAPTPPQVTSAEPTPPASKPTEELAAASPPDKAKTAVKAADAPTKVPPDAKAAKLPATDKDGASKRSPLVVSAVVSGLLLAGVAGWSMMGYRGSSVANAPEAAPIVTAPIDGPASITVNDGQAVDLNMAANPLAADNLVAPAADAAVKAPVKAVPVEEHKKKPKVEQVATAAIPATAPESASDGSSSAGASSSKIAQLSAVIDDGRGMAKQVIRIGRDRSGANGSDEERKNYQLRQSNAQLAVGYDNYLATLKNLARGAQSDKQADKLLGQAKQTRAYLVFLVKRSGQVN